MLLFVDQTFFQVLEGDPDVVQELYEKIGRDQRHCNVLMLAKSEIEERNFGDWSMGFVRDRKAIAEIPGFIDFFSRKDGGGKFVDLKGDAKRIRQIVDGFRRGRWRRDAVAS